jgi:hypothetical protein
VATTGERTCLTIDIPVEMKHRLRLVAAQRDISMRQYLLETIEGQLAKDWAKLTEQVHLLVLTAQTDTVLAELWDNEKDAAYDRL